MSHIHAPKDNLLQALSLLVTILLIGLMSPQDGLAQSRWPTPRFGAPVSDTLATTGDFYVAPNGDDSWPGSIVAAIPNRRSRATCGPGAERAGERQNNHGLHPERNLLSTRHLDLHIP